jgi:hypothetical protein
MSPVRVGGYIVNSLDCYSYRLIGKLTDETDKLTWVPEDERNQTVDHSTSVARRSRPP